MPKYRQLHTKIVDSFDFSEMPDDFTRLFWVLLIVVVDSDGRGIDSTSWIRSRMFPLRENVSLDEIETAMDWLCNREMIDRYQVAGRKYFEVINFKSYQSGTEKEAKSIFPANPNSLQSYSRVTPELLPTKSASDADAYTDSNTDSNTDSLSAGENARFTEVRKWFEQNTGIMATPNDEVMIGTFSKTSVVEQDIKSAVAYWTENKLNLYSLRQLEKSVLRSMRDRVQAVAGRNGHKKSKGTAAAERLQARYSNEE
jgi:hypothetical protein